MDLVVVVEYVGILYFSNLSHIVFCWPNLSRCSNHLYSLSSLILIRTTTNLNKVFKFRAIGGPMLRRLHKFFSRHNRPAVPLASYWKKINGYLTSQECKAFKLSNWLRFTKAALSSRKKLL